jgi:hypothetical protein
MEIQLQSQAIEFSYKKITRIGIKRFLWAEWDSNPEPRPVKGASWKDKSFQAKSWMGLTIKSPRV